LLAIIGGAERVVIIGWGIAGPFAIVLYWYCFSTLIPAVLPTRKPLLNFFGRIVLLLALAYFPMALFIMVFVRDDDAGFGLSMFNTVCQLLITAPLAWLMFRRHMKGREELYTLKKELGQSNANFDFLRSQINPHFLFNALNTLYGTALQEGAERTGEGIEKLGSMMRFMLQENMQEKISLSREIEYLNNYINLQKLRTDTSPDITIHVAIEDVVSNIQVPPMLLIPFVENAFKHGISFREPSHIKIALEVRDRIIYFDVHNSKHDKAGNDPEQDKSGIGLSNVKQRLQLMYPGRHELVIRETGKDFFVHLTILSA
jgi:LytS/YehU family sensor histidine kinase